MNQNNEMLFAHSKDAVMKRFSIALTLLAALAALGCNEAGSTVDRVQTSLVDKSVFEGEWWYTQATIDVDGDEALGTGGFMWDGGNAYADFGINTFGVPRIRWVIDEDYLYAYRSYELVSGGNADGRDEDYRGQPLAVYKIERHVDVRADYNPVTGEKTNVKVEDSADRRWYERRYMYVDWSQNMVSAFYGIQTALHGYTQYESAPFFFEEGAHGEFPASWAPQFVRIGQDETYRFADEWTPEESDTVHYMSFVTQYMISPGANCLFYGGLCQTSGVTVRHSYLRVPPNHEYAVETQTHQEFDRFGLFRAEGRTFVRGNRPNEDLHRYCETDADCGTAGSCDTSRNICAGGLARHYGETDYLNFFRPRFNLWSDSLYEDQSCVSDWECSEVGSKCDLVAGLCTIPVADRPTRQVVYHLNKGYPKHLVTSAIKTVGVWNEVFMRGQRAITNTALPDGSGARVSCQNENPAAYCHCTSPEAVDGTCKYKWDPFQTPDEARAAGVVEPYDCYVQRAEVEPAHPTSYDDYSDDMYDFEFVGEECLMVLRPNSCDADPEAACEEQGDLRYQFFNYIQHGGVRFGGVAEPLMDVKTGELVISDANVSGTSVESVGSVATEWFPALRCANEELGCAAGEEGADVEYIEGESVRQYFSRTGQTWHPQTYDENSGTDGTSLPLDGPRPSGLPVEISEHLNSIMEERMPHIERLRGADGRASILSGRMENLAGTALEARMLGSLGADGLEALRGTQDPMRFDPTTNIMDDQIANQISPFRGAKMADLAPAETQQWRTLGRYNVDPPFDFLGMTERQRYWEYWAEAFRGYPIEEQNIRMQQLYMNGVMHHELGHCMGMRHNFGSSFDRDNYYDGALNVMYEHPLPDMFDYDTPGLGGNADGFIGGEEVNRYYDDLREVRNVRAEKGMHNFTSASVMEYAGDLSDFNNQLGHYDVATVMWSHFDMVDAFVGDPVNRSDDSLNGALRSHEHERKWFQSYRGGESCQEDTHCPYNEAGAVLAGQPITQRCIKNPRVSRLPTPCGGDANCVCSGFDEDFLDYVDGVAYDSDVDGDDVVDYYPTRYMFCSDERVNDISWCNTGDAGESFQEAIDHWRRLWEESYPRAYYRRFRRSGPVVGGSWGYIMDAAKIYQHLFFRYFYEPGFSSDPGPLGFNDQYFASIDSMNWLTEIVNLPDTGSYALEASSNTYERLGGASGMPGADISLETGQGYPMWSQYQDGYSGFFRMERGGVFWDKFLAMMALALRDWGLSFTIDERFYINYYDLFPIEMTEFFGGVIIDDPSWFAPRVVMEGDEPHIQHLSWWRSAYGCERDGRDYPCRGGQPEVYPGPALDDTTNPILRDWAAMLALAQFPVFYDTTFEQRVQIFKMDSGEGWDIPNTQPDGSPTCAYGTVAVDPAHDTGCAAEDSDYIVFDSDRFHQPYMAVKVRSRIEYNLEEEQIGFQLLRRAVDLQTEVRALRAIASPTPAELEELHRKEDELHSSESFLEYLIDLQRRYGISAYFL